MSLAADTCGKILNIVTTVRRLEYSIRSVCFSLLFLVKQPRDEAMCALFFFYIFGSLVSLLLSSTLSLFPPGSGERIESTMEAFTQ